MPVRGPVLLHRMALVSFRLFCKIWAICKNFLGKWSTAPPGRKLPVRLWIQYAKQNTVRHKGSHTFKMSDFKDQLFTCAGLPSYSIVGFSCVKKLF